MSSAFLNSLLLRLAPLAMVTSWPLFGGTALFREGQIFGFLDDDTLYLKADAGNEAFYKAAGSIPFVYHGKGRPYVMSYWRVPTAVISDGESLHRWCQYAYEAGQRQRVSQKR